MAETEKSDHKEYIVLLFSDAFLCICGNTPSAYGFYPINENNEEVEPTKRDWTTNEYACYGCGRIIDNTTLEVVRRVELKDIKQI